MHRIIASARDLPVGSDIVAIRRMQDMRSACRKRLRGTTHYVLLCQCSSPRTERISAVCRQLTVVAPALRTSMHPPALSLARRLCRLAAQQRHQHGTERKLPCPRLGGQNAQIAAGGFDFLPALQDRGDDDRRIVLAQDLQRLRPGVGRHADRAVEPPPRSSRDPATRKFRPRRNPGYPDRPPAPSPADRFAPIAGFCSGLWLPVPKISGSGADGAPGFWSLSPDGSALPSRRLGSRSEIFVV